MKKKCLSVFLTCVLLICAICPNTAFAQTGNTTIQPNWQNVNTVTVTLSFSGNTAYCGAMISAYSGTTQISATAILERKDGNNYVEVKRWSNLSSTNQYLSFSGTYSPITSGFTYRLTIIADVTRNGVTETVSNWIEKTA